MQFTFRVFRPLPKTVTRRIETEFLKIASLAAAKFGNAFDFSRFAALAFGNQKI